MTTIEKLYEAMSIDGFTRGTMFGEAHWLSMNCSDVRCKFEVYSALTGEYYHFDRAYFDMYLKAVKLQKLSVGSARIFVAPLELLITERSRVELHDHATSTWQSVTYDGVAQLMFQPRKRLNDSKD